MHVLADSDYQIWKEVLYRCDPEAMASCSKVSKLWKNIIAEEEYNKSLLNRCFPYYQLDFQRSFRQQFFFLKRVSYNLSRAIFTHSRSPDHGGMTGLDFQVTNDNKLMICLEEPNAISVIDNATQVRVHALTGHPSSICALHVFEDKRLLTASQDGMIRWWNLESGECFLELEIQEGLVDLDLIQQKNVILAASQTGKVTILSFDLKILAIINTELDCLTSMAVSPDQNLMILSSMQTERDACDSELHLWSLDKQKRICTFSFTKGIAENESGEGDENEIRSPILKALIEKDGSKIYLKCGGQIYKDGVVGKSFVVTLDFS